MLYGIGTMLGACAIFGAALIGSNTFERWRQQKLAERCIDQAERILTATYNVRRGLLYVRNPTMWAHETDAAEEQLKTNGQWQTVFERDEQRSLATAQAYYNRLNKTKLDQKALEDCLPMARALFGEELENAMETLNRQFWTVQVYVDANHRDKKGGDFDFRRKIESTIWAGYPSADENEIDQIIASQVRLIEDFCVPVLRMENRKAKA